jgi:hypothetical protein
LASARDPLSVTVNAEHLFHPPNVARKTIERRTVNKLVKASEPVLAAAIVRHDLGTWPVSVHEARVRLAGIVEVRHDAERLAGVYCSGTPDQIEDRPDAARLIARALRPATGRQLINSQCPTTQ